MKVGSILIKSIAIFLLAAIILGGFVKNAGQLQTTEPIAFMLSMAQGAQAFTVEHLPWMIIGSVLLAAGWSAVDQKN